MSNLPGTNTLLIGATGSGKTHAARTLAAAGIEVFYLALEPGVQEVLADPDPGPALSCEGSEGVAPCHYHYIPFANPSWKALSDHVTKINKLSFDALTRLRDINKAEYGQLVEVYGALANFECDVCGEKFGPVDSWGPNRAIYIDSLSGLSTMAMDLVVGSKPVANQGDWGIAMKNIEMLVQKLCVSTRCWFVLCAHPEKEYDEVTGSTTLMVSTLGKRLAPRLPRFFSDVVLTVRSGDKFAWDTSAANVDLKARNLPIKSNLAPDFGQIVRAWRAKGGGE